MKIHIKKGDTVKILTGNSRKQTGRVLFIDTAKYRAVVEGINMVTKHVRPNSSKAKPEGGRTTKEASVHISNLMLVDPANGQATRVGRKKNENNKLQRYSKKTGEFIKK